MKIIGTENRFENKQQYQQYNNNKNKTTNSENMKFQNHL